MLWLVASAVLLGAGCPLVEVHGESSVDYDDYCLTMTVLGAERPETCVRVFDMRIPELGPTRVECL